DMIYERTEQAVEAAVNTFQEYIHDWASRKGWWDEGKHKSEVECLMLVVTELSEAVEYLRHGNGPSDHIPEFSGVEEEISDSIVRLLDMSGAFGYRIGAALISKMRFNEGRPYR